MSDDRSWWMVLLEKLIPWIFEWICPACGRRRNASSAPSCCGKLMKRKA